VRVHNYPPQTQTTALVKNTLSLHNSIKQRNWRCVI